MDDYKEIEKKNKLKFKINYKLPQFNFVQDRKLDNLLKKKYLS